jgi:hypothetical protein
MSLVLSPERANRRPARSERAGLPASAAQTWYERDLNAVARCVRGVPLAFATGALLWALLGAIAYGLFALIGS